MKDKIILVVFLIVAVGTGNVLAHGSHKVMTYAYQIEDKVVVEGILEDGSPVVKAKVKIYDQKNRLISKGVTNQQGIYKFSPDKKWSVLRVVLFGGVGHKSEYKISNHQLKNESEERKKTNGYNLQISEKKLQSIIQQKVKQKLIPIRKELARLQAKEGSGLTEILGGLGYILGLVGITLYFKAKQRKDD